jgi:hypothetical protein
MRAVLGLALLSVTVMTGCPGDDGGSDPDDLVGTWQEVQTALGDPSERETLVVNADGTYARSDTTGPLDTGSYDADSHRVTIHATANGESHEIDQGYLIDGDQLAFGTLVPDGTADGLVGTWHGEYVQDSESIVVDIDLGASGSATYHANSTEEGEIDFTGTWEEQGSDVVIVLAADGSTISLHAKFIAGKAIADKLYQRTGGP